MSETVQTFEYDNLIAGSQKHIVQSPGTVRAGEAFSRGAILGKLTSTGKWQEAQFSTLGSFDDLGIAVVSLDTTDGELNTTIYVEGEFNENAVGFFYTNDADDWRETLAAHGIYLRSAVKAAPAAGV
jgi:hypothetical protein